MNPSRPVCLTLLAGLALLMLATRFHHFLAIPDASWAIFFVAGFYLSGLTRWALPLLMIETVLIDWFAMQQLGVSDFCLTPAYGFLVPTHAALWLGGHWMRRHATHDGRGLLWLALSAFISVSLAFVISNGGFYWFSGAFPSPSAADYVARFFDYYGHFLAVPCAYIAAAAAMHLCVGSALRTPAGVDSARR